MQQRLEGRNYLNPTILAQIGNLELIAKYVVEGFISGLHKSPYHGFSVEFSQYRQYMPGDDTKHIDWKVYGRTDRYYIKQFEEETNLNCYILLDTSQSMAHPAPEDLAEIDEIQQTDESSTTGPLSKLRYGCFLIASLSYFMAKQRDAVGFAYFDDKVHQYLPARSSASHMHTILLTLENIQTEKQTRIGEPLHQIAERLTKRGLVILISDLYDENPDEVIEGLEHLRYDGHEVIVFHILSQQEVDFEFERLIRFVDSESDQEIITTPQVIQESYLSNFNEFINHYRTTLNQSDIDYNLMNTTTPIDRALSSYLAKRQGFI